MDEDWLLDALLLTTKYSLLTTNLLHGAKHAEAANHGEVHSDQEVHLFLFHKLDHDVKPEEYSGANKREFHRILL